MPKEKHCNEGGTFWSIWRNIPSEMSVETINRSI